MPPAGSLVEQARQRLASELARLPSWDAPLLLWQLRGPTARSEITLGAHAHFVRAAYRAGDTRRSRELFVLLLERTAGLNRRWAERVTPRTMVPAARAELCEELLQELTLELWAQMACGNSEMWPLFFQRSLDFTQRHVATAYMQHQGLWAPPNVKAPSQIQAKLLVSLQTALVTDDGGDDPPLTVAATLATGDDPYTAAELSDLRTLVARLPLRERIVVAMRFWQNASEKEMAQALNVSVRSVRNYIRDAYNRLRSWYDAQGGADV